MAASIVVGLLTACALMALLAGFAAYKAEGAARRAEHSANQLLQARSRIIALEHSLEGLDNKHRKLAGRVYANEREERAQQEAGQEDQASVDIPGPVCDNWLQAKIDGPRSRAANCECGYCEAARAARDDFRRATVPARVSKIRTGAQ